MLGLEALDTVMTVLFPYVHGYGEPKICQAMHM